MASQLRFGLLGATQVLRGAAVVPLSRGKLRVLLASLLVEANRTVPFERLVERLWGETPPSSARSTVHVYVRRLRRALGDDVDDSRIVQTRPHGYAIEVDPKLVDVALFRHLLERARQANAAADLATESALLTDALRLWRGPALADVPSDSLHLSVVPRLAEERVQAAERRLEVELQLGRHDKRVGELAELTREHPLRERLWLLFMLALSRSGRQVEALKAYRRVHALFRDELGIEPSEALQRLHKAILAGDQDLEAALPGWARTVPERGRVTPCQLPPDSRTFVGRTRSVEELLTQLAPGAGAASMPVVILSGSPGVGKTALALRVAHRLRSDYPDGQLYVNLQGYASDPPLSPAVVLARFLSALGVPANQMPTEEDEQANLYRSLMTDSRVLVVLDNASEPRQVRPLLPGQPGCAVLVTSRDHLRGLVALDGGHHVPLAPLDVEESRAVLAGMLGATRMSAEPDAVDDVAAQCGQLPLALRIAAANLQANPHLSVASYAEGLRVRGRLVQLRVHGDAQAAVQAAFDLSYARLDAGAARLFRLLSAVPGPDFGPPVAAVLVGCGLVEAERLLDALTAASLVFPSAPARYQFHDLLREYAAVRGDAEEEGLRAATIRLFDFYLHTARAAAQVLYPDVARLQLLAPGDGVEPLALATEAAAMDWMDQERPNLVAAALRARDQEMPQYAWRLADSLRGYFWDRGQPVEGLAVCDAALTAARQEGDERAEATVLDLMGLIHYTSSRYDQAERLHSLALEISRRTGDLDGQANSLHNLGRVCSQLGQPERVSHFHTEALELAYSSGNLDAQALNINYLGVAHLQLGQPHLATREHQRALELSRSIGNQFIATRALNGLALAAWSRGELREAIALHLEGRALAARLGNRLAESGMLIGLAEARCDAGEYEQAIADARLAISIGLGIGERRHEVGGAEIIATARLRSGHLDGVIDDLTKAVRLAQEINFGYGQVSVGTALAGAYRLQGDPASAVDHAERALRTMRELGMRVLTGRVLVELGHARVELGDAEQAVVDLDQALDFARRTGQRLTEARARYVYGMAQYALHGTETARPHWHAAERIFSHIGAPETQTLRLLHRAA